MTTTTTTTTTTTATANKAPAWFWIAVALLLLWEAMGCFACISQIREGPAAMGPVDDWSRQYYAALPAWYNAVYVVATFGALIGGLLLLARSQWASAFYWVSLAAIVVMFGYAFLATDLIAHKGLAQVLPFPVFIAAVGAVSVWFAGFVASKSWYRR